MVSPNTDVALTMTKPYPWSLTFGALYIFFSQHASASVGDWSQLYRDCFTLCQENNCSEDSLTLFNQHQPLYMRLLLWDCGEECKYNCMWNTVEEFRERELAVPQFHGKWPFVRMFGVQEPASVVFSVLNGLAHFIMLVRFLSIVPSTAPNYLVWKRYGLVCMNAWFWSAIFHTRDFPLTEKLDYFCALSLVLYSFYGLCARVIGSDKEKMKTCAFCFVLFYIYHIGYLAFIRFDYGYNMKANVTVGLFNSLGWIVWSVKHYSEQHYVWKCLVSVFLVNVLLLLELGDFPPVWWIFDAHSLWHLGTAPLPFIWYSFLIDDCLYLQETKKLV